MENETAAQLRLEPCSFRRHYFSAIGYVNQLFHAYWVKGKGNLPVSAVNTLFQLFQSPQATNKINTFICAQVFYVENRGKNFFRENRYIQHSNRVIIIISAGLCRN